MALRVVEGEGAGADVGGFAAEDFFGLVERRAALPLLDDERVAGLVMVPGPQSRATSRVSLSFQLTFCLLCGRMKPSGTNLPVLRSNSRDGVGVFAAGGEVDHAVLVAGVEAVDALGRPSCCVVLFAERVEVDDGLPVWVGGEVVGERGLAVDAADVLRRRARSCRCRRRGGRAWARRSGSSATLRASAW